MESHWIARTTPYSCLGCGRSLDGHLSPEGVKTAEDGDASMCVHCRCLQVFTPEGFRWPTDDEFKAFMSDVRIQQAIRAIEKMHRVHPDLAKPKEEEE